MISPGACADFGQITARRLRCQVVICKNPERGLYAVGLLLSGPGTVVIDECTACHTTYNSGNLLLGSIVEVETTESRSRLNGVETDSEGVAGGWHRLDSKLLCLTFPMTAHVQQQCRIFRGILQLLAALDLLVTTCSTGRSAIFSPDVSASSQGCSDKLLFLVNAV